MSRFLSEDPSEQSTLFIRAETGQLSPTRECTCRVGLEGGPRECNQQAVGIFLCFRVVGCAKPLRRSTRILKLPGVAAATMTYATLFGDLASNRT